MTEFESQVDLDVSVDDRSLTEARADIESALSSAPIDVQAEVSASGGEAAARDRARQRQLQNKQISSIDSLREEFAESEEDSEWQLQHRYSSERNRVLTAISQRLDSALEETSGGGEVAARDRARSRQLQTQQLESMESLQEEIDASGAGNEWQRQHRLSRERNRLLQEIARNIDEGNFDQASRAGGVLLGGGLAVGGAAILGIGALGTLLSGFEWPSMPEFSWPDLPTPPPPQEPDWHPLEVGEPDPIPVAEPDAVPVEEPREQPVQDPREQPVEDPKEQPVEEPSPVPTPEPSWTPIEVGIPELSTSGATDEFGSSIGILELIGIGAGGALGLEALRNFGANAANKGSSATGGAFLTPEGLGMTDFSGQNRRRSQLNQFLDDRGVPEPFRLRELNPENEHPGSVFSSEGRQEQSDGLRDVVDRFGDAVDRLTGDDQQRRTEVDVETNIAVDGATRQEVERAAEQAKEEALREFNRQITGRGRIR